MISAFNFHAGELPLLISVPHDGLHLPVDMRDQLTPDGAALPDTDWHVGELYGFARELGASMLLANYSRYVVDLNRSAADEVLYEGQVATGLCPTQTFAGDDIYVSAAPGAEEVARRVESWWRPYHEKIEAVLAALRDRHGYALLWDAHSIASVVPRLFDGELPALNIGTHAGRSCAPSMEQAVAESARDSAYSSVLNGRFQGGYITRHYGDPGQNVHAIQLEIAQREYMDESTGLFDAQSAAQLRGTLRPMLEAFLRTAKEVREP